MFADASNIAAGPNLVPFLYVTVPSYGACIITAFAFSKSTYERPVPPNLTFETAFSLISKPYLLFCRLGAFGAKLYSVFARIFVERTQTAAWRYKRGMDYLLPRHFFRQKIYIIP